MVKFGKKLLESQYSPWDDHYIDYKRLKKLLSKRSKEAEGGAKANANANAKDKDQAHDLYFSDNRNRNASGNELQEPGLQVPTGEDNGNRDNGNGNDNDNSTFQFTLITSNSRSEEIARSGIDNDIIATKNTSRTNFDFDSDFDFEAHFRQALDREIEGVVLFFLKQQGQIATQLSTLSIRTRHSMNELDLQTTRDLLDNYRSIGSDILRLIEFIELNVMAVRKILKKHDKLFKMEKISNIYLSKTFTDGFDTHLNQLYHYGGISALVTSLRTGFYELGHHEGFLLGQQQHLQLINDNDNDNDNDDGEQKGQQQQQQQQLNYQVSPTREKRYFWNHPNQSQSSLKNMFTSASSMMVRSTSRSQSYSSHSQHRDEEILHRINIARRHLYQSKEYVDVLASQLMMLESDYETESATDDKLKEEEDIQREIDGQRLGQRFSSMLNLISTLLYMTNYYIVAPTCGLYAEELGSSSSMAGVIIGMTPLAALIASVLYGWWSNYSYKSALLFASFCCIFGDLLYALALHYNSLNMVIVGRYLNGFGSARAINRRYIADSFSRRERTAASAAFVTAGALGMALGPAIAALLGHLSYNGNDLWTVHTAPGWIMSISWIVFFVCTALFFEDPEQRKKNKPKESVDTVQSNNDEEMATLHNEKSALLPPEMSNGIKETKTKDPPLWKNIPVMSCLWIYFVLKLVLECLLSSSAILTSMYFNWDMTSSGSFLAILGLLMFPANLVVAKMSREYDERELIVATLYLILAGLVGIMYYRGEDYTAIQYIFFAICVFLGTNSLEGPNMSLLSKTVPTKWAKGTFNSGLLATEAGTFGRVVGDGFISCVSFIGFDDYLLNGIFIPILILVLVTVVVVHKIYFYLEPKDDDDDDDDD